MATKRVAKRRPAAARSQRGEAGAYQIVKPEQLEAVVSTRRHDIMDQMTAFGPMSVRELAEAIGVATSSLYYHIEHLCSVGLLQEAGIRQTNGKPEQLYAAPSRRMRMLDALKEPRNKEVLKSLVSSICRQALRDFARGYDAPHRRTTGARRNMRFARLVCRPDAGTLEQINAHLDAITELISSCANGSGERVAFTWVVAPLRGKKANAQY